MSSQYGSLAHLYQYNDLARWLQRGLYRLTGSIRRRSEYMHMCFRWLSCDRFIELKSQILLAPVPDAHGL